MPPNTVIHIGALILGGYTYWRTHARTHARTDAHLQVAVSIIGDTGGVPKEVEAVLHLGVDIVVVGVIFVIFVWFEQKGRSVGQLIGWSNLSMHAC